MAYWRVAMAAGIYGAFFISLKWSVPLAVTMWLVVLLTFLKPADAQTVKDWPVIRKNGFPLYWLRYSALVVGAALLGIALMALFFSWSLAETLSFAKNNAPALVPLVVSVAVAWFLNSHQRDRYEALMAKNAAEEKRRATKSARGQGKKRRRKH